MIAYRSQSVTKAADELDMTQSAVSNALARLKENAGQELFSRTGRGIKPTRFAQDLYERLSTPLLDIEACLFGLESFDPAQSKRSFVVYVHEGLIYTLQRALVESSMPAGIDVITKELPATEEEIYDDLSNEKVDLVIDVVKPTSRTYASQPLTKSRICCVVRKGHSRLSNSSISKDQYLSEKHAIFNLRRRNLPFVGWIVDEVLPQRAVYSQHSSLMGMMSAISFSDAVATVPHHLALQYQDTFDLQVMDFPFDVDTYQSYLVWNSRMNQNKANLWLRDLISDLIGKD
ncbi:LysR family transcriptional regulator [Vibrio superstes NBRC 103154]|uniref:LysR family transcriptional regulator n=1 Tax=Vibrio superstes NBRC 103154 TaxID=1219062 RepID=A0A511QMY8_9VIBR|nr:LysR family transcriptional regulator [Vibrio superstes NBRC 103154]